MKRLKLFLPLLVFVALSVLFWRGLQLDPEYMPSALIDRPVPEFSLPSLHNGELVNEDALVNGVTLVNVWATWCPACHVEHPYLNQLSERGIRIVGLNYKDDDAAARRWLHEKGDPYSFSIADSDGMLGLDFGVTGAPETYVVDARGIIRFRYQGPLSERVWQQHFEPLLAQLGQES